MSSLFSVLSPFWRRPPCTRPDPATGSQHHAEHVSPRRMPGAPCPRPRSFAPEALPRTSLPP